MSLRRIMSDTRKKRLSWLKWNWHQIKDFEKMIIATKQLFYAMKVHKLLHFQNADMSVLSFAMTVHGLMDYELDLRSGECEGDSFHFVCHVIPSD